MNVEIRYLSKSGNTKKVADAIAEALNLTAKPITEPVDADTELLFLGGAVYAFGIDDALKSFIMGLPKVQKVAIFSTSAVVKSAAPYMKKLLSEKEIPVADAEFHCRGVFKFMHKGHPDVADLKEAREFALALVSV